MICYLADEIVTAKMLSYNRANRAVAVLCNHQVFDGQRANTVLYSFLCNSELYPRLLISKWVTFKLR